MSTQRVCDLDRQVIDPTVDEFFTIKNGRTGQERDICAYCARSKSPVVPWQANTTVSATGVLARPTAGIGKYVFLLVKTGQSGPTEPAWPTADAAVGSIVDDGTLKWKTYPAPRDAAIVDINMPGTAKKRTSIWGWMTGTNETVMP